MKHLWILILLLAVPFRALACDKPAQAPSVDDVVYNTISAETSEIDLELQQRYGCKYPFAMLFSSDGYVPMRLVSGSQPATPTDEAGNPITGEVLIGFILNLDGTPVDPVVLRSQDDRLATLALSHVLGLKYMPSRFNSRRVRSLGVQVYNFK